MLNGANQEDTTIKLNEGKLENNTARYFIKENYFAGCTNNTVRCEVTVQVDGEPVILTAEIAIGFATFGSSGTDYTIVFTKKDSTVVVSVCDKNGNSDTGAPI
jgi:hypothetical protein